MPKKIDLFYTLLHLPIDALAIALAFTLSYWIRGNGLEIYHLPFVDYRQFIIVAVPAGLVIFALQGLYLPRYLFGTLQNSLRLALAALASWAFFVVYLTFLKTEQTIVFPRLLLIYILLLSFLFVLVGRLFLRLVQYLVRRAGIGRRRLVVLGLGEEARTIIRELGDNRDIAFGYAGQLRRPINPSELASHLRRKKIDDLVITSHHSPEETLGYLEAAHGQGVACHLVPNMFEVEASNVLFEMIAGVPILTFRQTPLEGWGRIVKRIIDIVVAGVALVLLSPLFVVLALLIVLGDRGPVFYRHLRISRGGKKIHIFKFRTMYLKYCTGPGYGGRSDIQALAAAGGHRGLFRKFQAQQKLKEDPRVSPIGRFLRRSSLDELPQLFNVLVGELSLVGPRPIVEEELTKYGRWGSYLLSIKPGMTGLWQVSGRSDLPYEERVQLDAQYVKNWSLWQDFVILVKTGLMIVKAHNGY